MKVVHGDSILASFDKKDNLLCLELTERKDWLCGVFLTEQHTRHLIGLLQTLRVKFKKEVARCPS